MKNSSTVLIHHRDLGIYLGSCLGLGFWSRLDPVGQDHAVVFESEQAARAHIETWDKPQDMDGFEFVAVTPDLMRANGQWASIKACEEAGLSRWDPDASFNPAEDLRLIAEAPNLLAQNAKLLRAGQKMSIRIQGLEAQNTELLEALTGWVWARENGSSEELAKAYASATDAKFAKAPADDDSGDTAAAPRG